MAAVLLRCAPFRSAGWDESVVSCSCKRAVHACLAETGTFCVFYRVGGQNIHAPPESVQSQVASQRNSSLHSGLLLCDILCYLRQLQCTCFLSANAWFRGLWLHVLWRRDAGRSEPNMT